MKLGVIKSLLILLLICTAIVQTGTIWFQNYSGRNFFYNLFSTTKAANNLYNLRQPSRMIFSSGTKSFYTMYPSSENENILAMAFDAMSRTIAEGTFVKSEAADWNNLLSSKAIVFEYALNIPSSEFSKSIDMSNSNLTSKIAEFNRIVFLPAQSNLDGLFVVFVNASSAVTYELKSSVALSSEIANIQPTNSDLFYISSVQSGINIFEDNVFILQSKTEAMAFPEVSQKLDYNEDTDYLSNVFFDNLSAKTKQVDNEQAYIYSDRSTVVKYYPNGLFQFSNYSPSDGNSTIASSYMVARSFLAKDTSIINGITLVDAVQQQYGWTFYFDYTHNSFAITLGDELINELGIKNCIEITADDTHVIKYSKLAASFYNTGDTVIADVDFAGAVNSFAELFGNVFADNIQLLYQIDKSSIELRWQMFFDGGSHSVNAKR